MIWEKHIPFFEKPDILASEVKQIYIKKEGQNTSYRGYNKTRPIVTNLNSTSVVNQTIIFCPSKKELVKSEECKCGEYDFSELFD